LIGNRLGLILQCIYLQLLKVATVGVESSTEFCKPNCQNAKSNYIKFQLPTAGARGPEFNSRNAPNLEGFVFFIHGPSKPMLSPESQTFNQSDFVAWWILLLWFRGESFDCDCFFKYFLFKNIFFILKKLFLILVYRNNLKTSKKILIWSKKKYLKN